jgi:6-phospho-beta-glucosidase
MTKVTSKHIKIGVIGGGSVFTPELIQLLGKNTKVTGPIDVCLMDILPERLKIVGEMCQRLIGKTKEPVTITMVTDSSEAIKGADFVCNQLRAGGLLARIEDERLGRKYKLPFTETVSVCGFATYLRSFPEIAKLAEQIKRYSPDAWVLNFANPAGMLSETFYRFGVKNVIGVCNVSEKLKDFIAERLHVSRTEIFMNWRGLNHMTFVDKVFVHGKDLFDEVIGAYDIGEQKLPFPKELIQDLHLLPNQYLQYYYLKEKIVENLLKQDRNRSEVVLELEKELLTLFTTADEIPDQLKKRGGYGYSRVVAGLIRDMIVDGGNVHYGIVRNGTTIREIPEDGFVEVPILAHKNRIETLQVDPLPSVVVPLVVTLKAYEDMLIDASFNKDKNQLLKSLIMHPLIPTYATAKSLLEDVLRVNDPYLDWFKS